MKKEDMHYHITDEGSGCGSDKIYKIRNNWNGQIEHQTNDRSLAERIRQEKHDDFERGTR